MQFLLRSICVDRQINFSFVRSFTCVKYYTADSPQAVVSAASSRRETSLVRQTRHRRRRRRQARIPRTDEEQRQRFRHAAADLPRDTLLRSAGTCLMLVNLLKCFITAAHKLGAVLGQNISGAWPLPYHPFPFPFSPSSAFFVKEYFPVPSSGGNQCKKPACPHLAFWLITKLKCAIIQ